MVYFVLTGYVCNLVFGSKNTFHNAQSKMYINFKKIIDCLLLLLLEIQPEP